MRIVAYFYTVLGVKRRVSVTIDEKIYREAKDLGINVSKASENYLITLINAIQQSVNGKQVFSRGFSAEKSRMVRSPGFEPGSSAWQSLDWKAYRQWLTKKNYRGSWKNTLYGLARKYGELLFTGDLGKLSGLTDSERSNALKGLSAFSKFLGCYDSFQKARKDYGLKWGGTSTDDLIIDRLNKVDDPEEVWQWIREAKKLRPDLSEFLDLIAVTGLRLVETVECYNLIIDLTRQGKLDSYFVNGVLEHYRFKERFIRRNKKVFISYVPAELVKRVGLAAKVNSANAISAYFRRNGEHSRFSDVREAHGTFMIRFLKKEEVDFLHGRVSTSTFTRHYFNPSLIADLRERVFKGVNEILEKIK